MSLGFTCSLIIILLLSLSDCQKFITNLSTIYFPNIFNDIMYLSICQVFLPITIRKWAEPIFNKNFSARLMMLLTTVVNSRNKNLKHFQRLGFRCGPSGSRTSCPKALPPRFARRNSGKGFSPHLSQNKNLKHFQRLGFHCGLY